MKEKSLTCYDNRELSWLKFNKRVLEEAEDMNSPLCERMSFLSIFQSNLDEFFMVRAGSLYDQMLIDKNMRENKTNMTCEEQLSAIYDRVRELTFQKDEIYKKTKREMAENGVELIDFASADEEEQEYLHRYFTQEVKPLLSPQVVGKKQPFPFLNNKEVYAVVVLEKKDSKKIGIIPCSRWVFGRLVCLPGGKGRYILIEDIILHYIPEVFEKYKIKSKSLIRVIRNADIDPDEELYGEDADFRQVMEQLVKRRKRLCPIKVEYSRLIDETVIEKLCHYLGLKREQVFHSEAPLDLSFLGQVSDLLRGKKELFFESRKPRMPETIDAERSMIDQILEKDRLLAYPFESMKPFLRLLSEAAADPEVISIKMTLYRVASHSKVAEALMMAAENGKEVVVLVELRARFDEENNIEWSRKLEDAGCRIIYGLDHLKVHSKLCQITRKSGDGVDYITQIVTGNYNEKTAAIYTDLSLMTADRTIGLEAAKVLQELALGQVIEQTEKLLVAPKCLQDKILDKIDRQIALAKEGKTGYIGLKMNSLTDKKIIDKLIEASQAGVQIEMVIRGICCLVAGVPGYTENITVRSIVGRYLEHSRIYIFGGEEVYISSADFMTRNTVRRVEVAVPILDSDIKRRIINMFDVYMSDNVKARIMQPDGSYERAEVKGENICAQDLFFIQEA